MLFRQKIWHFIPQSKDFPHMMHSFQKNKKDMIPVKTGIMSLIFTKISLWGRLQYILQ